VKAPSGEVLASAVAAPVRRTLAFTTGALAEFRK